MKYEFKVGQKVNLETLKKDLGVEFVVIQLPHTITVTGAEVISKPLIIETLEDKNNTKEILDSHAPEFSDDEIKQKKISDKALAKRKDELFQLLEDEEIIDAIKKSLKD